MTALPAETDVDPYPNPGCPDGPQGFHIYDVMDLDNTYTGTDYACLYCDRQATELEILSELVQYEPPPGSVVIAEGLQGHAWQRYYAPPTNWKTMGGRGAVWNVVLERSRPHSRVWLVFVPPVPRSPR